MPPELDLERDVITRGDTTEANIRVLSESVFGEPLLLVGNQVPTSTKKRADILALDRGSIV